ncbi:bifunctional glutamate N-acetyltransferase/amino-acid acetyltransferase ArgJ [Prochlorococcus marinus XMU1414]|uniref:Arginine biosynthesis bifunctional protein ArgJ n=1 Tax=Prochlorococcus marinus XMU1424 TaxID=2774497 RepID=A0A9D9G033_PROMR|nr:bifunctional glutamate N-acetyltransferase/amino-acid acetyltransferase ArgJ [Prochlorococcus marinus]MBO8227334.1 bifunctional glutamate N-acetyltransferase/amino-acid acetyltransferase ArgJ [Prochlorococcus marinus XMU1414]MBW3046677.1 arginine biosynthesis bifunctional protein ArgJ [Prochlorococcus marinus str. MU1414]MCR8532886.1 bifunctional glutamate N-acetyltransferase/amino-acid acetyltransferase ArgJ [Prochlorococcus marinus XMU1420]MCR8536217.1 bifunctional glutamate N-acetyltransf
MSQVDSNWSFVDDSKVTPTGFLFAGISAGLKASNKKDLALILAPVGSIFSGMFTQSIVRASCVDICEERIKRTSGFVRAILINSGQANACTGNLGIQHFQIATGKIAELLGIKEEEVLMCSTGVIGVPIQINDLVKNLPTLVSDLKSNNFQNAAEAILTTDLTLKKVSIETMIQGRKIKIAGFAKGSGMIYPKMATMLAFLICDAGIQKEEWDKMIAIAVKKSFNAISVDGETSTNDSFVGINAGEKIEKKFFPIIQQGIDIVCQKLAKSIARDGEGANCLLEVLVQGAKNTDDAIMLAKSICNSALVKTAIHGCDPNWGRIISAAGNSGVKFNLNDVDLYIGNAQILENGKLNKYDPQKVTDYIKSRMKGRYLVDDIVKIMINLNSGESKGTAWGCDLSKKYVEINSEYTT